MKNLHILVTLSLVLLFSFYACNKSDGGSDLTTEIVGKYNSSSVEITVNKVDKSTVSMLVSPISSGCYYNGFAFTNVKMNSASSFTLNETNHDGPSCKKTAKGTGTVSGNNITLFMNLETDNTNSIFCCNVKNENLNYSASK